MSSFMIFILVLSIPFFIGLWFVFKKAGKPGWTAIIPIYNIYVWLKIIKKPLWWFVFFIIPFLNIFMVMLMLVETAKTFKKFALWQQGVAVVFAFAYMPYLGLSKVEAYTHPDKLNPPKKNKVREWTDAIIFAVVAALIIRTFLLEAYTIPTSSMEDSLLVGDFLFVSKFHYGPKSPNTPLTFPFTHNTMPRSKTKKSYLEWLKLPYHRFPGLETIENNDVVVFNYPSGDTLILENPAVNYYDQVIRSEVQMQKMYGDKYVKGMGRKIVNQKFTIISRPVDKRDNYIKRCIAIPGDVLEIKNKAVYINGKKAAVPADLQYSYFLITNGMEVNSRHWDKLGITDIVRDTALHGNLYIFHATEQSVKELKAMNLPNVKEVRPVDNPKSATDIAIFPHDPIHYPWNLDNFGPLHVPQAGEVVKLDTINIALYKRIIQVYEENELLIKNGKIYINGKESTEYHVKMNYYWMMGDNRHNSLDSRYWGFVPEDHIVGKALFVWLSIDKSKGLFSGLLRWGKMFRRIK